MNEYRDRVILVGPLCWFIQIQDKYNKNSVQCRLTDVHVIAFCIKEIWAVYWDLYKGFGHDWSKAFCTEPNQGIFYLFDIVIIFD